MLIAQEHSPAHAGPWPETEFYLEFENVGGSGVKFHFDPGLGLHCEVLDANGKLPPPQPMGGSEECNSPQRGARFHGLIGRPGEVVFKRFLREAEGRRPAM
jgi:hypothetical protein